MKDESKNKLPSPRGRRAGNEGAAVPHGMFLVYQAEDGRTKIEVRLESETVWLTQQHMADLFQTSKQNVGQHLKNIFAEREKGGRQAGLRVRNLVVLLSRLRAALDRRDPVLPPEAITTDVDEWSAVQNLIIP